MACEGCCEATPQSGHPLDVFKSSQDPVRLSPAALAVWAKDDEKTNGWLPLYRHMSDTAAIARHLWSEWLPERVRATIATDFEGDQETATRCVVWLAGVHDVGKATPAFAMQVSRHQDTMRAAGFDFRVHEQLRSRLPHSLASQLLLRDWLVRNYGFTQVVAETYAVIPGSHHGVTPSAQILQEALARPHLLGDTDIWRTTQDELAAYAASIAGIGQDLRVWVTKPLSARSQILITAVVIIADWLASTVDLFPYQDARPSNERAEEAWRQLLLPSAWKASELPRGSAELFHARFSLPINANVRPIQEEAIALAHEVDKPGLMIIEAPMGEGKTEAALAVAEVFAYRTGAGGVFIALPTMATSDAMFARVKTWVERLPAASGSDKTMFLAHGKAALNEEFQGLVRDGRIVAVGNDEGDERWEGIPEQVVIAHEWLMGRKKGPLANFVVGTVDQVLFGALKSRHLMLRHLALVNKVVVIDEVHAYDVYMNVYLDRVLGWLGHYGVPVILLSATLPAARRRTLLNAYVSESVRREEPDAHESMVERKRRTRAEVEAAVHLVDAAEREPVELAYPLITASTSTGTRVVRVEGVSREQKVRLEKMPDGDETLLALLEASLVDGGCVMIVRNTVDRAQQTMKLLEDHFGDRHTLRLAHSRFIASDRMEVDTWLRTTFGSPESMAESCGTRPGSAIVVGTQVLEQSLDIDFDLLVTDLAPTDLILQRIGRLHRHDRGERPLGVREPRCVVVGVEDWAASPPVPITKAGVIYDEYTLLRTARVLDRVVSSGGMILLPADIPKLVEETYGAVAHNGEWQEELDAALAGREDARTAKTNRANSYLLGHVPSSSGSIVGWQDRGVGDASDDSPGAQAQVRDTEDTLEVLVVQRVGDEIHTLPHPNRIDRMVPTEGRPPAETALAVAQSSIRLPGIMSKPWMFDRVVGGLEHNAFTGWQLSPWLKGQLVLVLDENLEARVAGYQIRYSTKWGLEVEMSDRA
jgi:CRISPR-associated endonuclease/helicase Cas3